MGSHRVDLDRVNVNVSDCHLFRIIVGVHRSQSKVVVLPTLVDLALLSTFSIRNIVCILYHSNDLALLHLKSQACPYAFLHVNFTVVLVSQAGINGVFHAESRASTLVLECHQEPLVLSVRVTEHVQSNAFVVLLVAEVRFGKLVL